MLRAAVAALACLCLARVSAELHGLRAYAQGTHSNTKDLTSILANIEDRLRVLDTISAVQAKQARRLDVIQDKLDRIETALSLRLERTQLAVERLEHRLHMLQTNVQATVKEGTDKIERSQKKIEEIAQNLTIHVESHRHSLEKTSGAYNDAFRRSLILESLMRDGLSLVNVTRRELADGLRTLARRQRDARLTSTDLETAFARRLNDNTFKIDLKMQEVLDTQKHLLDTCQSEQRDDPRHMADVLDKLIDSLINKTMTTFQELQNIQSTLHNHDSKVAKLLTVSRSAPQSDATCRRLENVFRNASQSTFKENELHQLTEKFIALTDRADAAIQRLEVRLNDDEPPSQDSESDVTSEADRLILKLNGIKNQEDFDDEEKDWDDAFDDDYGGGGDIMDEDKILTKGVEQRGLRRDNTEPQTPMARPTHLRHLHKHPYDRGPGW